MDLTADPATAPRLVALQQVHNFRDLGGYPTADGRTTRWRRLFRADGLHRLSGGDLEVVRRLGIRTVLDLRSTSEVEKGRWPLDDHPADYHHLPMFDVPELPSLDEPPPPGMMVAFYVAMCATGEVQLADALRVLARSDGMPAVFHCAVGKDRTGVLAALVLTLLGVPDEVVAADYALSREGMARFSAWLEAQPEFERKDRTAAGAVLLDADPATIVGFLDVLRQRHGSVEAYVASLGVGPDVVDGLAANLLERPGAGR